jgi:hypothetical protein
MLDQQIAILEEKRDKDFTALQQQMGTISGNLKAPNLMKNAIQQVATDPEVRSVFKKAVFGLLMGIVADKIVSLKPGKKSNGLLGMALNVGINLLFANRYAVLKSTGALVVTAVVAKLKKRKERKRLAKNEVVLIPSTSN